MALSKTTQDHNEIQQWAEARGAIPAEVASTETQGQTGILRIEFPNAKNANDSALKEISWDDFFEKFDASGLALVYQEQTAEGEQSNFNKLIYPEDPKETKAKPGKSAAAKKATGAKAVSKAVPAKKAAGAKSSRKAVTSRSAPKSQAKSAKAAPRKAKKSQAAAKKAPAKKIPAKRTPAKKTPAKKASGTRSRSR